MKKDLSLYNNNVGNQEAKWVLNYRCVRSVTRMNTRKFTLFPAFTRIHVSRNNCFALNWPRKSVVRIHSGNVNAALYT